MIQKTGNRMSRDGKKVSSPRRVLVRLQPVSAVTCVCVFVRALWSSGGSCDRAVGTVKRPVI
jgi:hypothetical protein